MMDKKRALECKIKYLLDVFPCVAIIGSRQVGKSTLTKLVTEGWDYYDLEKPDDYQLISSDPVGFFERKKSRVIIDEAQQFPDLFKVLRGVIDKNRSQTGRFILTGSSSPKIVKGLSESLAGRIATVELSPFSMREYYSQTSSNFYDLIRDAKLHKIFYS